MVECWYALVLEGKPREAKHEKVSEITITSYHMRGQARYFED